MASLSIAVIVPIGTGEAPPPELFFERVRRAAAPVSLLAAADARIRAETREVFRRAGAALLTFEEIPRGARLARAVQSLSLEESSLLLFLHADTILPSGWEEAARAALTRGAAGGAFRLGYAGGGWRMTWVAWWANLRTWWTRVPYGDQAPFVRRDAYERLGGHRPWPLLEDWDFSRRLVAAEGRKRVALLRARVATSPRRYLEKGVWKTVRGNWEILRRVRGGESPVELAKRYRQ
ncbi:MAG: hypothetical protein WCC53_05285 [Thermoanaerobaculia bacterium]